MRWTAAYLASGMQSLLSGRKDTHSAGNQGGLEGIRMTMLEALEQHGSDASTLVHLRVRYANDLEDLWYLRGDVMAAIAANHGESIARKKIEQISNLFKGLLPKGLVSRPSPLC
jgi:hypothetical protein